MKIIDGMPEIVGTIFYCFSKVKGFSDELFCPLPSLNSLNLIRLHAILNRDEKCSY
jgi:hypothetical protein